MKDYRQLLRDMLRALEIESLSAYRWFGVRYRAVPSESQTLMSPDDLRRTLRFALRNRLYSDFYCAGGAYAARDAAPASRAATMSPFLRRLSEANAGVGSRESGWRVLRQNDQFLVLERHGLTIWAKPIEVVEIRVALPGQAAATAVVSMPKELFRLSPGFYMALGDEELQDDSPDGEVRYYWNLRARSAPLAMRLLTRGLNDCGLAFRFKVLADEAWYTRADAGVLYLRRRDVDRARPVIEKAYDSLHSSLNARTPALVQELAPGLGFAESPSDVRESFGTARCQCLAEGILRAFDRELSTVEARLRVIEECLSESGIALEAPYLNRLPTASGSDITAP